MQLEHSILSAKEAKFITSISQDRIFLKYKKLISETIKAAAECGQHECTIPLDSTEIVDVVDTIATAVKQLGYVSNVRLVDSTYDDGYGVGYNSSRQVLEISWK